jgi:hypothetical protein
MGVLVNRTPKCHCELAGKGIEYTWGCSKNYYRALKLQNKRGKEKFRRAVAKCLERDILTTERIRKFSRRARQYICEYYKIAHEKEAQEAEQEAQVTQTGSYLPMNTSCPCHPVVKKKLTYIFSRAGQSPVLSRPACLLPVLFLSRTGSSHGGTLACVIIRTKQSQSSSWRCRPLKNIFFLSTSFTKSVTRNKFFISLYIHNFIISSQPCG